MGRRMKLTAEQVKTRREAAGLTREQLAKKCNVSPQTVRGWESTHSPGGLASAFIAIICTNAKKRAA